MKEQVTGAIDEDGETDQTLSRLSSNNITTQINNRNDDINNHISNSENINKYTNNKIIDRNKNNINHTNINNCENKNNDSLIAENTKQYDEQNESENEIIYSNNNCEKECMIIDTDDEMKNYGLIHVQEDNISNLPSTIMLEGNPEMVSNLQKNGLQNAAENNVKNENNMKLIGYDKNKNREKYYINLCSSNNTAENVFTNEPAVDDNPNSEGNGQDVNADNMTTNGNENGSIREKKKMGLKIMKRTSQPNNGYENKKEENLLNTNPVKVGRKRGRREKSSLKNENGFLTIDNNSSVLCSSNHISSNPTDPTISNNVKENTDLKNDNIIDVKGINNSTPITINDSNSINNSNQLCVLENKDKVCDNNMAELKEYEPAKFENENKPIRRRRRKRKLKRGNTKEKKKGIRRRRRSQSVLATNGNMKYKIGQPNMYENVNNNNNNNMYYYGYDNLDNITNKVSNIKISKHFFLKMDDDNTSESSASSNSTSNKRLKNIIIIFDQKYNMGFICKVSKRYLTTEEEGTLLKLIEKLNGERFNFNNIISSKDSVIEQFMLYNLFSYDITTLKSSLKLMYTFCLFKNLRLYFQIQNKHIRIEENPISSWRIKDNLFDTHSIILSMFNNYYRNMNKDKLTAIDFINSYYFNIHNIKFAKKNVQPNKTYDNIIEMDQNNEIDNNNNTEINRRGTKIRGRGKRRTKEIGIKKEKGKRRGRRGRKNKSYLYDNYKYEDNEFNNIDTKKIIKRRRGKWGYKLIAKEKENQIVKDEKSNDEIVRGRRGSHIERNKKRNNLNENELAEENELADENRLADENESYQGDVNNSDNKSPVNIDDSTKDEKMSRGRNSNTKNNLKNLIKIENPDYYDITNMKNNENDQNDISKSDENNNDFDMEPPKNENQNYDDQDEENDFECEAKKRNEMICSDRDSNHSYRENNSEMTDDHNKLNLDSKDVDNEQNKSEEMNLIYVKNKLNYNNNSNDIINIGSSNETGIEVEHNDNMVLRKDNSESSLSYSSINNNVRCKVEESDVIENASNNECENDMSIKNNEKCVEENSTIIKDDNEVDIEKGLAGKRGIKNEGGMEYKKKIILRRRHMKEENNTTNEGGLTKFVDLNNNGNNNGVLIKEGKEGVFCNNISLIKRRRRRRRISKKTKIQKSIEKGKETIVRKRRRRRRKNINSDDNYTEDVIKLENVSIMLLERIKNNYKMLIENNELKKKQEMNQYNNNANANPNNYNYMDNRNAPGYINDKSREMGVSTVEGSHQYNGNYMQSGSGMNNINNGIISNNNNNGNTTGIIDANNTVRTPNDGNMMNNHINEGVQYPNNTPNNFEGALNGNGNANGNDPNRNNELNMNTYINGNYNNSIANGNQMNQINYTNFQNSLVKTELSEKEKKYMLTIDSIYNSNFNILDIKVNTHFSHNYHIALFFLCKYTSYNLFLHPINKNEHIVSSIILNSKNDILTDNGNCFVLKYLLSFLSNKISSLRKCYANALYNSYLLQMPIRIFRHNNLKTKYGPNYGIRYDGIYKIANAFTVNDYSTSEYKRDILYVFKRLYMDKCFIPSNCRFYNNIYERKKNLDEKNSVSINVFYNNEIIMTLRVPYIKNYKSTAFTNFNHIYKFIRKKCIAENLATEWINSDVRVYEECMKEYKQMKAKDLEQSSKANQDILNENINDIKQVETNNGVTQIYQPNEEENKRKDSINKNALKGKYPFWCLGKYLPMVLMLETLCFEKEINENKMIRTKNLKNLNISIKKCEISINCELAKRPAHLFIPIKSKEAISAYIELKKPFKDDWNPYEDLSAGKEKFKIPVENEVDNDLPPMNFTYVNKTIFFSRLPPYNLLPLCSGCTPQNYNKKDFDEIYINGYCKALKHKRTNEIYCDGNKNYDINDFNVLAACSGNCLCDPLKCINKFPEGLHYPVKVVKTVDVGWDIVACSHIKANSLIMHYVGEITTRKEMISREHEYDKKGYFNYFIETAEVDETYADDWKIPCIDALFISNVARFLNHSCEPNVNVITIWRGDSYPSVGIFSSRDISPNEPLKYHYGINYKNIKCMCRSKKCKGYIG
ncbi:SET domain protein, putative [Plasmodium vinckei brucechwatti]|uniref:SET domain protein, putative n=1 Tax=Plasmodium vinckei brucechwatti TaxID=119398 RepID=A0A6V7S144_PLAVN|nr:SET domain protein, putative [Plasmodium vinckei brucechwatti]